MAKIIIKNEKDNAIDGLFFLLDKFDYWGTVLIGQLSAIQNISVEIISQGINGDT